MTTAQARDGLVRHGRGLPSTHPESTDTYRGNQASAVIGVVGDSAVVVAQGRTLTWVMPRWRACANAVTTCW